MPVHAIGHGRQWLAPCQLHRGGDLIAGHVFENGQHVALLGLAASDLVIAMRARLQGQQHRLHRLPEGQVIKGGQPVLYIFNIPESIHGLRIAKRDSVMQISSHYKGLI